MDTEAQSKKKTDVKPKSGRGRKKKNPVKEEDKEDEEQDLSKKCKRGYKFCKNEKCREMVHIHNKKCPICGFEFENRLREGDDEDDYLSYERISTYSKKVKGDDDGSGFPDRKSIKRGFFKVRMKLLKKLKIHVGHLYRELCCSF